MLLPCLYHQHNLFLYNFSNHQHPYPTFYNTPEYAVNTCIITYTNTHTHTHNLPAELNWLQFPEGTALFQISPTVLLASSLSSMSFPPFRTWFKHHSSLKLFLSPSLQADSGHSLLQTLGRSHVILSFCLLTGLFGRSDKLIWLFICQNP